MASSQSHIIVKRIIFNDFQDDPQNRVQSNEFFSDYTNFPTVNLSYGSFLLYFLSYILTIVQDVGL